MLKISEENVSLATYKEWQEFLILLTKNNKKRPAICYANKGEEKVLKTDTFDTCREKL